MATFECIGSTLEYVGITSEYAVSTLGYIESTLGFLGSIWVSPDFFKFVYQQFQVGKCKNHHFRPLFATFEYIGSPLEYVGSTSEYSGIF